MLEKRTVVDRIEVDRDGVMCIRLTKEVLEDGNIIASTYHRTLIEPGASIDDQMATVNADLVGLNAAEATASDIGRLKAVAATVHTDTVIAAYEQERAEAAARREVAETR